MKGLKVIAIFTFKNNINMETWKKINDFDNYEVSDMGNVRHVVKKQNKKFADGIDCYKRVTLRKNNRSFTQKVPRLVAVAFIDNPENRKQVDHINNKKGDNRVTNLRWSTNGENGANKRPQINNTSGLKGVCYDKAKQKWLSQIQFQKKHKFIGYYDDKIEAGKAYDAKARELFGEYALCNFSP